MTDTRKPGKKFIFIISAVSAFLALVVILATCAMFDQKSIELKKADWSKIVYNSSWAFSDRNVGDVSLLIPALRDIVSVEISSDGLLVIHSNSYNSSYGPVVFSDDFKTGSLSVSQASDSGYVTNNINLVFSNQEDKKFDSNNYILTFDVADIGSLYFFKI